MTKMNLFLIFGCVIMALMQPQPGQCLRMKRSQTGTTSNQTTAAFATEPPKVESTTVVALNSTTTTIRAKDENCTTSKTTTVVPIDITLTEKPKAPGKGDPVELRRAKRRMELDEPRKPHHKHRHQGVADPVAATQSHSTPIAAPLAAPLPPSQAPPPFVYYNKMISPDGKHEVKEFELLAPNMVIESVQQELNYGPEMLPPELAGVLLLNAADNVPHAHSGGSKHHHKHKSSPALPPMLYMLQQLLQPTFEGNSVVEPPKEPRHRMNSPLYQFLDGAMDLRNNQDLVLEHLLGDHLELEHEKDIEPKRNAKDKNGKKNKEASKQDLFIPNEPQDELLVSCPIHHEIHPNRNGEMVDDEVVLVNECHVV